MKRALALYIICAADDVVWKGLSRAAQHRKKHSKLHPDLSLIRDGFLPRADSFFNEINKNFYSTLVVLRHNLRVNSAERDLFVVEEIVGQANYIILKKSR